MSLLQNVYHDKLTWSTSHSHTFFFPVVRTFKMNSLSNFQIHARASLAIFPMLYMVPPGLIYLITGSLFLFDCIHPLKVFFLLLCSCSFSQRKTLSQRESKSLGQDPTARKGKGGHTNPPVTPRCSLLTTLCAFPSSLAQYQPEEKENKRNQASQIDIWRESKDWVL